MTIKKEVTKPNHYQIDVNGKVIETKDIVKALLTETTTFGSVPFWYGNAIKYITRMFKKHDDPITDLDKTIECLLNIREEYTGERYELKKVTDDNKALLARQQLLADFIGLPEFPHIRSDD